MEKYVLPNELKNKNIISITTIKNKKYGIIIKCLESENNKIRCSFYRLDNNIVCSIDDKNETDELRELYFTTKRTSEGFIEG